MFDEDTLEARQSNEFEALNVRINAFSCYAIFTFISYFLGDIWQRAEGSSNLL